MSASTIAGKDVHISPYARALALAATLVAVVFVYAPGLNGPFVFDDIIALLANPALIVHDLDIGTIWDAALSGDSGPLRRPIPTLSFAVNYYFAGGFDSAFSYKATNLAIHVFNTALVCWFSILLLRRPLATTITPPNSMSPWLPLVVAAVWALHPLHLTTVLYVVQRMATLATTFVLLGLVLFLYGRERIEHHERGGFLVVWMGIAGGAILGVLSKENAVILPALALLLEILLFDRQRLDSWNRLHLYSFYAMTLALPAAILCAWVILHPELILEPYKFRDFSLGERLLTQSRVTWFYLGSLVFPSTTRLALFHDDIEASRGLWEPPTTAVALFAWAFVITLTLVRGRRNPLLALGVLWYLIAHSIESSVVALELAHEHRTYLPDIGVIVSGVFAIAAGTRRLTVPLFGYLLSGVVLLALAMVTYVRANTWSDESTLITTQLAHHPSSARSHAIAAEFYAHRTGDPIRALHHLERAHELAPNEPGYVIRMLLIAAESDVNGSVTSEQLEEYLRNTAAPVQNVVVRADENRVRLAVSPTLVSQLTTLLLNNPITTRTEQMLIGLADCVTRRRDRCGDLYPITTEWLVTAVSNPRINARVDNNLIVALVNMLVELRDHSHALEVIHAARHRRPDNVNFMLMESNVQWLRGEHEAAALALAPILEGKTHVTQSAAREAQSLATLIRERKRGTH